MSQTQTWWLSFTNPDKPRGEHWLGVAILDITEAAVTAAEPAVTARRALHGLPPFAPGAWELWMAAAIRVSHAMGCNPGGEVGAVRLDDMPWFAARGADLPRNRLLTQAEWDALKLV